MGCVSQVATFVVIRTLAQAPADTHTHTHTFLPQPQACPLFLLHTEKCSFDSSGWQWERGDGRGVVEGDGSSHHGGPPAWMTTL